MKMIRLAAYSAATYVLFGLSACKKDEDKVTDPAPTLQIPTVYDSVSYGANTINERALRRQMSAFVSEIKKGRPVTTSGVKGAGTALSLTSLNSFYTTGSLSLQSSTTTYYKNYVDKYMQEAVDASTDGAFTLSDTAAGGQGGYFGDYLFNEKGIEPEQILDKGLFGAAFYNKAVAVLSASLTTASVDQLVVLFGASPLFPATNTASKTSMPDGLSALYAARRDKLDGNGFYTASRDALLKAKAAIAAGATFNTQRDEAVRAFWTNWEKSNFATVVNYCYDAKTKLSKDTLNDAAVLHALSECVGFMAGWKTIDARFRLINDSQIDELLTLINAPSGQDPTFYYYLMSNRRFKETQDLDLIMDKIKSIYGFSDQQMIDFRENWITKNGR